MNLSLWTQRILPKSIAFELSRLPSESKWRDRLVHNSVSWLSEIRFDFNPDLLIMWPGSKANGEQRICICCSLPSASGAFCYTGSLPRPWPPQVEKKIQQNGHCGDYTSFCRLNILSDESKREALAAVWKTTNKGKDKHTVHCHVTVMLQLFCFYFWTTLLYLRAGAIGSPPR